MDKRILLFSIIIVLTSCGTARLTENEAILLAEKYILEQGFTDKKVQIDSTKVDPDYVEQIMSRKGILNMRYNTLKPKAVFHSKGLRRWTVGFQNKQDTTRFRILRIYRNGKKIQMEHQDLKLMKDL